MRSKAGIIQNNIFTLKGVCLASPVGKPDAYWLKAIQDPQGEGRGRMCRYPSPDRAYAQDTWLFFARSMKLYLATGLTCLLMASCSKTPLPWKPSIEDQKTAQLCIVDESISGKCGEGDIITAQMIYQACIVFEDFEGNQYDCDNHATWLPAFSSEVEAEKKRKAEQSAKSSAVDPIEACRQEAHLAGKRGGVPTYRRAKANTANNAKLVFMNQGVQWETNYFCD